MLIPTMAPHEPLPPTLRWQGDLDGELELLDQTLLPNERVVLVLRDERGVADAIVRLAVRGAPAIGVAAAYGLLLGVRARAPKNPAELLAAVDEVAALLAKTRPTAVNLVWALQRMQAVAHKDPTLVALLHEAQAIHLDDTERCARMGQHGASLIREGMTVLTHCNTGRLATAGDGTALSLLFAAHARGVHFKVLADETRPLLQGGRLTALELHSAGIPVQIVADGAAAGLIARGEVDLIVVGADRVAANGDFANKVGTYGLSLAAAAHQVPFWAVAPLTTFDAAIADGSGIPIEERDADEVLCVSGQRISAPGIGARNPAFDVTPARLVTGFVTDQGRISPVTAAAIKQALGDCR